MPDAMHPPKEGSLRIAIFTDTYPPQVNGVARTLARLTEHLVGSGHQVALVTTKGEGAAAAATEPHFTVRLSGVPVPVYPELLLPRWPARSHRDRLEAFDPHVVHCATESVLGWWGRRWARRTGRALVTSFHTNFPTYARGYGLGFAEGTAWALLRRFHAPAVQTLAPSLDTIEDLRGRGFHPRLGLWSRGVDQERFSPTFRSERTRRELAPGAQVVLLYVGRLAPEKRLPLLLEAFGRVRSGASVAVGLVLVGGGPMEAALRHDPPPGVHLAGYRTGADLSRAYASADLFAFPSDTETFGNVVLEAMASGLPVVGVDRGGVRDQVIPGETGFLTPPGSVEPFAEALLRLVEDPLLRARFGTRGRTEAEGRSWPRILDGVVEVYRSAASGVPDRPLEAEVIR
jgi:phosphatidylinositol alpha 1,6-mannosyltransferase